MLYNSLFASLLAASCTSLLATAASIPSTLDRRATPAACKFPVGRQNDYGYADQSDVSGHDTCVGWALGGPVCGPWSIEEKGHAMYAVTQQLTKDGQWESTNVGRWTASFNLLTTAFDDRNPVYFDHAFEEAQTSDVQGGAGAMTYYYMENGNALTLTTTSCP